jgi:hypothetical protein
MPRWPVEHPRATPHGAYGYVRRNKSEGACANTGYPCTHSGLDLAGKQGTPVYAPEDGSVHAVSGGSLPPFRGYGPGVILFRGKKTGVYHLLAHLERASMPDAEAPGNWLDYVTDFQPIWSEDERGAVRRQLQEGEQVGVTSGANHVHWEVREPGPFGKRGNPAEWLRRHEQLGLEVPVADFTASGGGGGGALLLLGLALLGGGGRKRRRR